MHLRSLLVGLGLGVGITVSVGMTKVATQDEPQMDAAIQEMMELGRALGTPGAPHEFLQRFVGNWEGEMSMMGMPGSPTTQTIKTELGGRFIRADLQGVLMGEPFSGIGITGYDNYKKKFNSMWIDSVGTVMHYTEGMMDQTGNTMTLWGTMDEWMTGEQDKPVKYVYHFTDDDT